MYNNLTSIEGKYLLYIINTISNLENNFNVIIKNRDFKLNLILYDDYELFKSEFENNLNIIKSGINKLNLSNLDTKELEKISNDIDILTKYFNYSRNNLNI